MSIANQFSSNWPLRPEEVESGVPFVMVVEAPHGEFECEIVASDSMSAAVQGIRFSSERLADSSVDRLRGIGNALSARLNYLLEPIAEIELDLEHLSLQLRSVPPYKDEDGRSYYEMIVRPGGDISLSRYRKSTGRPRSAIPAMLTREVLTRMVGDLDAVVVD